MAGKTKIEGYLLPDIAKVTRCSECGALLLAQNQGSAMSAVAEIPADKRPPFAVKGGREVFCPRCLGDDRRPDGTRRGLSMKKFNGDRVGSHVNWEESGSSFDNVVNASEEDR